MKSPFLLALSGSLILASLCACTANQPINPGNSDLKIVDNSLVDVDLFRKGSFSISEIDYASDPAFDKDVIPHSESNPDVLTDIRGRLYMPVGEGPFPVIIFLHGNHATCGMPGGEGNPRFDIDSHFTLTGECWPNYNEVPSHLGYEASARQLASWGYAVFSVNANRGINGNYGPDNDWNLIRARGALVLRHLEEFFRLSRDGSNPLLTMGGLDLDLQGKLDFSRVGFMGHSRGGEGVRYAYNLYNYSLQALSWQARIPGLNIRGIFEIGPVDDPVEVGDQSWSPIEARGTAWTVLIPGCDYDVYDLAGTNPFVRMLPQPDGFPKSIFTLWGANHNFFNSEWQVPDAPNECAGDQKPLWDTTGPMLFIPAREARQYAREGLVGSPAQIAAGQALLFSFFRANLSDDAALGHVFDPQYRLPAQLSALAPISREYVSGDAAQIVFEGKGSADGISADGGVKALSLDGYIQDVLAQVNRSWKAYSDRQGLNEFAISLAPGSAAAREALALKGKAEGDQDIVLPLKATFATRDFWTLDLVLSLRQECYDFDDQLRLTCPTGLKDSDFKLSLIREDGSETQAVSVADYIDLSNAHKSTLVPWGGVLQMPRFGWGTGSLSMQYELVPIIYQTVRFELTDFSAQDESIKAIKLHFTSGHSMSMLIESVRLSRRPE